MAVRNPKASAWLVLPIAIAACSQVTQNRQLEDSRQPPAPANRSPVNATAPAPKPQVAISPDGTRIAYEIAGTGPALLLLHGGGQTRRSWNQVGYVDRLSKRFTVITVDLRGSGDSEKPTTPDGYALERVLADLAAVADAARVQRFHVWGFGQGATIGRYLAARSDRAISAVLVGMTMGPAVTGFLEDAITSMRAKWQPLLDAQAAGTLDRSTLSPGDRAAWDAGVRVSVLSLSALLDYPSFEPAAIKVPTLWLVGSDDSSAENAKAYEGKLAGTQVTLKVLSSVTYSDSFVKIEPVLAEVEPFLVKAAKNSVVGLSASERPFQALACASFSSSRARADVKLRVADVERRTAAVRLKLDRLEDRSSTPRPSPARATSASGTNCGRN